MENANFHIRLEVRNPGRGHFRAYSTEAAQNPLEVGDRGEVWTDRPPRTIGHLLHSGRCDGSRHCPQLPA
ncbi:MAG: hypothetical protein OJF50_000731 [Nitrospira sp.]|nr:hypothetical protein [Nitrospira sp.]